VDGCLELKKIPTPSAPPDGYRRLYPKSGGRLCDLGAASPETALGSGKVPIGTVIAHFTGGVPNAAAFAEIRAAGFAVCDGTTPASQGISEAVITDAMPDLNGEARFLRGGAAAGTAQDHAMQSHTHAYQKVGAAVTAESGSSGYYSGSGSGASSGTPTGASGSETRPINTSVIWIMRVR
jgi:hypothetical protein